jgi:apolipoprotein D and lipocalin family protein
MLRVGIKIVMSYWLIPLSLLLAGVALAAADKPPVQTVPDVDLKRYAGVWHEIARYPNWFQKKCASDVTATYTLRPDGKITVLNQCRTADGNIKKATGTAKLADKDGPNSKLKVTFFWPFYGDYWIIALDPEYRWVLVGAPGRDYLWVLSRTPQLSDDVYAQILEKAKAQGFDVGKLVKTRQS